MRLSRFVGCFLLVGAGILIDASLVSDTSIEAVSAARAQTAVASQNPPDKPKEEDPVPVGARPKEVVGTVTPSIGPGQFGTFFSPQINNRGDVAFVGRYATPGAGKAFGQAIFLRRVDGQWKYLRDEDRATNLPDSSFSFGAFSLNDNGDFALSANFGTKPAIHEQQPGAPAPLPSQERNLGVFTRDQTGFTKLVALGEEVPNMPSRFSSFANPSMNSKGTVVFVAAYVDPDGRGLFVSEQGKLRIVARSGQKIAPGEAQVFSEHYYPSPVNERGEVAFLSRVGVGAGIFVLRSTGIELLALDGKPSPVPGTKYLGFGNRTPAINDKGDVVFSGFYDGPAAGRALFYKAVGQPVKLLLTSTDKTLKYKFTDFMNPEINNRGEIVFVGRVEGLRFGIFVKTAKGIEPVALSGDLAPGLKPGEEFNHFSQQPQINDRGEVVFYGQLKNASVGIFIKDAKGLRPYIMRGDKLPFEIPPPK